MITERVRTTDGVTVGLHHLEPAAPPTAPVLLLLHGAFSGHTIWLRSFAGQLAKEGYDIWLADFRGHGVADREPAPRTWWFDDLIERDAPPLVERLRAHIGSRRLGVIGHSAGGVAGLAALARAGDRPPWDALVTLGTPGPSGMGLMRYTGALGFRTLALALGRFPARALRFGRDDEGALMFGQWMAWNLRGRWLSRDGFDYLEALSRARTPFLGVAGGRDLLFSPPYACREIVERIGSPTKDFHIAPSLNHPGLVLDPRASTEVLPPVV
ncbi:MAG TPA: alpha/beta fold hydrolase, partial [Gemmatimonadales bacterium]|nr:alpha/beta fold hydrolase [Gemmatimonadales bacterium]